MIYYILKYVQAFYIYAEVNMFLFNLMTTVYVLIQHSGFRGLRNLYVNIIAPECKKQLLVQVEIVSVFTDKAKSRPYLLKFFNNECDTSIKISLKIF